MFCPILPASELNALLAFPARLAQFPLPAHPPPGIVLSSHRLTLVKRSWYAALFYWSCSSLPAIVMKSGRLF